jgi:prepilin-type N-terminal cleavage/methylation domain-containing protein
MRGQVPRSRENGVRSPDRARTGSGLPIDRWRRLTPVLGVVALSIGPVLGLFTTHRIFFVRDLGFFFWSRNLWLRHTLGAGLQPWWDPHVASGQPAIVDALNQLLMPLTLAIRLLPSDVVSFNLWVALPLPVAAVGTFGFLRRHVAAGSAALGAAIFVLSGPAVSMLNAPNLSWSVAFIPWVLWACDAAAQGVRSQGRPIWRPDPGFARSGDLTPRAGAARGVGLVAIAVALQALSGEPVTLASTALIAVAFVLTRDGLRAAMLTIAGFAAGAGLSAAQLLPMAEAAAAAHRGMLQTPDFWSLHPVSLWELIAPHLFGDYYQSFLASLPWMGALNFGRDPFFYSIYVGPIVLLLACVALAARTRRSLVWIALSIVFLVAALGGYTPAYPLARRLVPMLLYFRFPVKYMVVAAFTVAVLAADGFDALIDLAAPALTGQPGRRRLTPALRYVLALAASLGLAGLAAAAVFITSPSTMTRVAYWLATNTHLKDPAAGAAFLARGAPALTARAAILLTAGCGLTMLIVNGGDRARLCIVLLFLTVCADLAISNGGLNPTADVSRFAPPAWYTAMAERGRLYIGGRARGFMNTNDPDAAQTWQIPAEASAVLGRMELNAELPMAPSGWGVREALSYDLPLLWPAEYERTIRRFEHADARERDAFLRRSDVRWCVVSDSLRPLWQPIAAVPDWSMRVYDCHPDATRVFVATAIQIAASPGDEDWQRDGLFDPSLPDTIARLPRMLAAEGGRVLTEHSGAAEQGRRTGKGAATVSTTILRDTPSEVVVDASMPDAGVLVLRDTFDPSWHAQVDGSPADVVPANLLYRAVAVPAGHHTVRFTYRPRALLDGLMISGLTLIGLLFAWFGGRRARADPRAARGFTLIELMIVLAIVAILMSLALGEYRRTRAKGDETVVRQSLEAIASAQWQFAMTCGHFHYAASLAALGQPSPATGHAFLSPDLTTGDAIDKAGYTIHLTAKPRDDTNTVGCNGATLAEGFAATADPDKPGTTGALYFGVNTDRVVYADSGQTFTGNMPDAGAPAHGAEAR